MLDVSIWGAFIGGLIVFFSPCVLPIVPFYISYMAGAGLAGLKKANAHSYRFQYFGDLLYGCSMQD